jgi:hypothetical protein
MTATLEYKTGDATNPPDNGRKQYILQIVNDARKYGAGFSGALSYRFPVVESTFRELTSA